MFLNPTSAPLITGRTTCLAREKPPCRSLVHCIGVRAIFPS
jgi:hypothetical protein